MGDGRFGRNILTVGQWNKVIAGSSDDTRSAGNALA